MTTEYVDQSASGLRFYLVAAELDVIPFDVLATTSFKWNHCSIETGILGASHYLRIDLDDGNILTELFACADVDTEAAFLRSAPFSNLPAQVLVPFHGSEYRFVPRLVSWNEGAAELKELQTRIEKASYVHRTWGLKHRFPSLPGDDETKPPLTLVHARAGGQFTLKTAHCYPNEEQIVFTTTTISKKGQKLC